MIGRSPSGGNVQSSNGSFDFWRYKEHYVDAIGFVILAVIYGLIEKATPRQVFFPTDAVYEYSMPHHDNTVPSWSVFLIAVLFPIFVFVVFKLVFKTTWEHVFRVTLALAVAVCLIGIMTGAMKVMIGRPRPNFFFSCWPDGNAVWSDQNQFGGYADCSASEDIQHEHSKSFPSGHSSITAVGLGFLTLYLFSQTKSFSGKCHPWRVILSVIPALAALIVGVTRVMDYWHHPTDVIAGLVLGFVFALLLHQQLLPWFTHPDCHLFRNHASVRLTDANTGTSRNGSAIGKALNTPSDDTVLLVQNQS